ncbi:tetratricopeptide repeat protein [Kitasatospora sp. NPDC049258]|uniref:tetratricopeptide repeat protein n=1 Tax=Kitasatospora sp. NPDC049258 TaxID=3155394 RepID=UPI00342833E4
MDAPPTAAEVCDRLPAGAEPFAGRRTELAALATAATRTVPGRGRLVVLAGRPGSGRTSLAVHYARSVAAGYPDGLLFARMSAPDGSPVPPGRAARRLLEQLDAVPEGLLPADPAAEDPACAALRTALAGRKLLVLLDEVREGAQLLPLLTEEPGCLVLATTAGPLTGIDAIDPVILGGLDQPSAVALLGELIGGTRISCDPVGAADLAEACTSRPAALRLVAGRLRADARASVTDAAAELAPAAPSAAPEAPKSRGATKPKGRGPAADRRQARELLPAEPVPVPDTDPLVAAFALVYRALPAPAARMLRMLTLAPTQTADLRTASALVGCPAPEAGAVLEKLAGQELLEREPAAADGTARYRVPGRLHPRLVELRTAKDRPAEVELARARLLERLVRLVDSARLLLDRAAGPNPDPLPGPLRLRTPAQAAGWLAEERDQLLAAVRDAIGQGDLDGSAGRLVTALLRALPLTGGTAPADLHQLHELVLRVAERQQAPRRAAAALLNLADLQAAAGHWPQAEERYRAALDHARTAGDEPACARALEGTAGCHRALGDPVRAADWYGRALALRQSLGEPRAEARLLVRTAEAHTAQRRFDEAGREYRAAVAVLRRLGEEEAAATVSQALERLRRLVDGEGIIPVSE